MSSPIAYIVVGTLGGGQAELLSATWIRELSSWSVSCGNLSHRALRCLLVVWSDVATVRAFLQPLAIKDRDAAAFGMNQACTLQGLQCDGDTGAVGAEHQAEELVRKGHLFAINAIVRHQEPACQPLFDLAAPVRECGGCGLEEEGVRVAQHWPVQR